MPWKLQKVGDKYNVVSEHTGKVVGHKLSKKRAAAQMRALYANVTNTAGLRASKAGRRYKQGAKKRAIKLEAPSRYCTMSDNRKAYRQQLRDHKKADKEARRAVAQSRFEDTFWVKTPAPPRLVKAKVANGYPLYGQTRCPNCGHKVPRDDKECPFCGYKLKNKLTTMERPMKLIARNLINNALMTRKDFVGKLKGKVCEECGKPMKGAGKVCAACKGTTNSLLVNRLPKLGSGKRFAKLKAKVTKSGADDPAAVAAAIGRKKWGSKRMGKLAVKGRAAHNELSLNVWSDAARAAAIKTRHAKAGLSQRGRNSLAKAHKTMRSVHQKMGLKGKSLRFKNKQSFAKDKANLKTFER